MNRFDRTHVDGVGDGLNMALTILERSGSLPEARERATNELRRAREARGRDSARVIGDLVKEPLFHPA